MHSYNVHPDVWPEKSGRKFFPCKNSYPCTHNAYLHFRSFLGLKWCELCVGDCGSSKLTELGRTISSYPTTRVIFTYPVHILCCSLGQFFQYQAVTGDYYRQRNHVRCKDHRYRGNLEQRTSIKSEVRLCPLTKVLLSSKNSFLNINFSLSSDTASCGQNDPQWVMKNWLLPLLTQLDITGTSQLNGAETAEAKRKFGQFTSV